MLTAQVADAGRCAAEPGSPDMPDPMYVDPSPLDNPTAPAWAACFASLPAPEAMGQRTCARVDCPVDSVCDAARGGICVSSRKVELAGGVERLCTNIRCLEGSPVFENFRCRCGTQFEPIVPPELPPSGPPGPPGPVGPVRP